jgi:hypothetical protein
MCRVPSNMCKRGEVKFAVAGSRMRTQRNGWEQVHTADSRVVGAGGNALANVQNRFSHLSIHIHITSAGTPIGNGARTGEAWPRLARAA